MTQLASNLLSLLTLCLVHVSLVHGGIPKQFINVGHAKINTTVIKTLNGDFDKIVSQSDIEPLVLMCTYTSVLLNGDIQKLSTTTSFKEIFWRYGNETKGKRIENGTQGALIYTDLVNNSDQITTRLHISSNLTERPKWLEDQIEEKSSKFFIGELAGKYQCVFNTVDYDIVQEVAEINMEPIIHKMNIQEVVSGENALLACNVFGYPRPTRYTWLKQSADNYTVISGASNRTFLINGTTQKDRANYKCQVEVMIKGITYKDDQTLFLRVKDRYAALWPFIGILIEIFIMVVIIFFAVRRDKQRENKIKNELQKNS